MKIHCCYPLLFLLGVFLHPTLLSSRNLSKCWWWLIFLIPVGKMWLPSSGQSTEPFSSHESLTLDWRWRLHWVLRCLTKREVVLRSCFRCVCFHYWTLKWSLSWSSVSWGNLANRPWVISCGLYGGVQSHRIAAKKKNKTKSLVCSFYCGLCIHRNTSIYFHFFFWFHLSDLRWPTEKSVWNYVKKYICFCSTGPEIHLICHRCSRLRHGPGGSGQLWDEAKTLNMSEVDCPVCFPWTSHCSGSGIAGDETGTTDRLISSALLFPLKCPPCLCASLVLLSAPSSSPHGAFLCASLFSEVRNRHATADLRQWYKPPPLCLHCDGCTWWIHDTLRLYLSRAVKGA